MSEWMINGAARKQGHRTIALAAEAEPLYARRFQRAGRSLSRRAPRLPRLRQSLPHGRLRGATTSPAHATSADVSSAPIVGRPARTARSVSRAISASPRGSPRPVLDGEARVCAAPSTRNRAGSSAAPCGCVRSAPADAAPARPTERPRHRRLRLGRFGIQFVASPRHADGFSSPGR